MYEKYLVKQQIIYKNKNNNITRTKFGYYSCPPLYVFYIVNDKQRCNKPILSGEYVCMTCIN